MTGPQASPAGGGAPTFDLWARAATLAPLREALVARDWARARPLLDGLTRDEDALVASAVGETDGIETLLEAAVAATPSDPVARTLLAERYIRVGWAVRTRLRAEHVSADQFRRFREWLVKAERLLVEVCAEHPGYVPAWRARLTTARGLELGHAEARRRYDRLARLDAHDYAAQRVYLQQICPKWGGSWDQVRAFVAECQNGAPAGTLAPALSLDLHLEWWIEAGGGAAGRSYLAQPAVMDDVVAVANATVWHGGHVPGPFTPDVHSRLAFVFCMVGRDAFAAPHFRALDQVASEAGWNYLSEDPQKAFRSHRRRVLRTTQEKR